MRYDYHTYNRYMRRIKPETDIRVNELKKVISIIKTPSGLSTRVIRVCKSLCISP